MWTGESSWTRAATGVCSAAMVSFGMSSLLITTARSHVRIHGTRGNPHRLENLLDLLPLDGTFGIEVADRPPDPEHFLEFHFALLAGPPIGCLLDASEPRFATEISFSTKDLRAIGYNRLQGGGDAAHGHRGRRNDALRQAHRDGHEKPSGARRPCWRLPMRGSRRGRSNRPTSATPWPDSSPGRNASEVRWCCGLRASDRSRW